MKDISFNKYQGLIILAYTAVIIAMCFVAVSVAVLLHDDEEEDRRRQELYPLLPLTSSRTTQNRAVYDEDAGLFSMPGTPE